MKAIETGLATNEYHGSFRVREAASSNEFKKVRVENASRLYSVSLDDNSFNDNTLIIYGTMQSNDNAPDINTTNPSVNNSNTTDTGLDVNFTVSDDFGITTCWYSNDTYSINRSLICGQNLTNITWSQGLHNLTIYVNDSAGNLNFSSISFTIDNINSDINISFPSLNNTNSSNNNLDVNFTVSDNILLNECWYSNDTYTVNRSTGGCGINITNITWSEGLHNLTIYANDSAGNLNFSSISFRIDTTPPTLDNIFNQSIFDNESISFNFEATDEGIGLGNFSIDDTTNFTINMATGVLTNNTLIIANYTVNISVNDSLGNLRSSLWRLEVRNSSDATPPVVTINSPSNTTFTSSSITFNITLDENGYCEYTIDSGLTNKTMTNTSRTAFNATESLSDNTYKIYAYCNDTQGNINYTEFINFVVDVPSTSGSSTGSGSSGGSSGGSVTGCVPRWGCAEWSQCSNLSYLDNLEQIASLRELCFDNNISEIYCGYQIRICQDANKCTIPTGKPETIQYCYNIPKSVYYTIEPSCSDNIKNQGEEGVDCGGPCRTCKEIPLAVVVSNRTLYSFISLLLLLIAIILFIRYKIYRYKVSKMLRE
ncbi:hypothetical protein J4221_03050 [Candidatus Pacearchaeota archaeon]|nr:hypothetical protein [Candidatus Pacearchaeota archaeon]